MPIASIPAGEDIPADIPAVEAKRGRGRPPRANKKTMGPKKTNLVYIHINFIYDHLI